MHERPTAASDDDDDEEVFAEQDAEADQDDTAHSVDGHQDAKVRITAWRVIHDRN